MKFLFRHSSNSRKLSWQKFYNELACVFTAHDASKNADWNQQQRSGGGQGGGSPGEQGAGGVRETGEERAGSGISMMAGSGREIPKGKLSLIVTAHHPVKETNSTTFLDFHLTFSEALNQNFNARKVKKRKFALGIEKRALLLVKLETFPSRLHHRSRVLMNEVAWHMYTCVDCVSRVSVSSVWPVSQVMHLSM